MSEEDGRTGGREDARTGGREEAADGADTELKTKTPHVNVGKNPKHIALMGQWKEMVLDEQDIWFEEAQVTLPPLHVQCSGLGGGALSAEHEYDIFLQNHAQTKIYDPSLAMVDDWVNKVTQLGRSKSTALGWSTWSQFLPQQLADPGLLQNASHPGAPSRAAVASSYATCPPYMDYCHENCFFALSSK